MTDQQPADTPPGHPHVRGTVTPLHTPPGPGQTLRVVLASAQAWVYIDPATGHAYIGVGLQDAHPLLFAADQLVSLDADTLADFAQQWTAMTAESVAELLACDEIDTLANLLTSLGQDGSARAWIEEHVPGDEPGDAHYRPGARRRRVSGLQLASVLDSADARTVLDDLHKWAQNHVPLGEADDDADEADDEVVAEDAEKAVLLAERLAALLLGPSR